MKRRASIERVLPGHQKIGEHAHREAYLSPSGDIVKVGHSHRKKKIGPFRVNVPMRWQSIIKFGRFNPNMADFKNYKKYFANAPEHLAGSFARILRVEKKGGQSLLTMERVHDYNGNSSKTIEENGPISNEHFWKRFDEIVHWFRSNHVPFVGFSHNVMVKWVTTVHAIPVIIDYKATGWRHFPLQPWVWIPGQMERKMLRHYRKLKSEYKARSN